MMRAIETGGIPCVYSDDSSRDRHANPHGYYELDDLHYADWPAMRGKCVKVIEGNLHLIPSGEQCRVVYMLRPPAQIRASFAVNDLGESFTANYSRTVLKSLRRLKSAGRDVRLVRFAEMVENPTAVLSSLDWPIDVSRAAATIDPVLFRHRGAV